jgi:hypothetical protein
VSIDAASSHSLEHAEEEMFELELDNENQDDSESKPTQQEEVEEQVDEMADKVRNSECICRSLDHAVFTHA